MDTLIQSPSPQSPPLKGGKIGGRVSQQRSGNNEGISNQGSENKMLPQKSLRNQEISERTARLFRDNE